MAHSKRIVFGIGAALVLVSLFGLVAHSEALVVWPLVLLILASPAAFAFAFPKRSATTYWLSAVLCALWGLLVLAASSGGSPSFALLAAAVGGLVVFTLVAVALGSPLIARLIARDRGVLNPAIALATQILVIALVVVAAFTSFPFHVRFAVTRPAFDEAARRVIAGHRMATPARVGSFTVNDVSEDAATVTFSIGDNGTQLVFSPNRAPGTVDDGFTRLSRDWWTAASDD